MPRIFVCADLHFSHKNVIAYEDRPFATTDEMNNALIKNWNNIVRKDDIVFVLGDVAFASKERTKGFVEKLNGRKRLIMGNHDRGRSIAFWRDVGFEMVFPYPIVFDKRYILSHEPPEDLDRNPQYFYIYGHVHGSQDYWDHTDYSACVSVERINYTPALIEDVISGKAYEHRTSD